MSVESHKHEWSEWKDDKPVNIKSQKELIILSVRQCMLKGCSVVQSRIGRVRTAPTPHTERKEA